jgi:hypothetical protein
MMCGRARPIALGAASYPPQPARARNTTKTLALVALSVGIIAAIIGTGVFVYAATRPNPVLTLTSAYHVNGIPAGASSTTFSVHGQHFSSNEAITFILDGQQLFGIAPVESDGNGAFTVALPIGKDWTLGKHILTASDADHYLTKQDVQVLIVTAGQASTPGPNGAPSDNSSFKISTSFSGTVLETGNPDTSSETITVTGNPDPAGGSVCGENEGGLPFVTHSTFSEGNLAGTAYKETFVETCSGTYRGGKLEENVTVTSQYLSYTDSSSNDVICSPSVPYVYEQIQGTFSSTTVISGTYNIASARLTCTSAFETFTQYAEAGSWNGTVSSM